MFNLTIRPVIASDLPDILEVYQFCEDFLALGPVASASMDMVLADLDHSRIQGSIYCGIFDPSGKMLGVLDYLPVGFDGQPGCAFLELLMIRRDYRGKGYGHLVVNWLVDKLVKENHSRFLWSGVQVNNPGAVRFWNNHGFITMSEPQLMPDQTTCVRLLKTL